MVELALLSKYPFLNASKNYIKENNLSIKEILGLKIVIFNYPIDKFPNIFLYN